MQNQFKKLALICNTCFWLTIIFKYWEGARSLHADILGTIIVLGVVAVFANLAWLLQVFFRSRRGAGGLVPQASISDRISSVYNMVSMACQLVWCVSLWLG